MPASRRSRSIADRHAAPARKSSPAKPGTPLSLLRGGALEQKILGVRRDTECLFENSVFVWSASSKGTYNRRTSCGPSQLIRAKQRSAPRKPCPSDLTDAEGSCRTRQFAAAKIADPAVTFQTNTRVSLAIQYKQLKNRQVLEQKSSFRFCAIFACQISKWHRKSQHSRKSRRQEVAMTAIAAG